MNNNEVNAIATKFALYRLENNLDIDGYFGELNELDLKQIKLAFDEIIASLKLTLRAWQHADTARAAHTYTKVCCDCGRERQLFEACQCTKNNAS